MWGEKLTQAVSKTVLIVGCLLLLLRGCYLLSQEEILSPASLRVFLKDGRGVLLVNFEIFGG